MERTAPTTVVVTSPPPMHVVVNILEQITLRHLYSLRERTSDISVVKDSLNFEGGQRRRKHYTSEPRIERVPERRHQQVHFFK